MANSKPYKRPGVKRNITASNTATVLRTAPIWVITQQAVVIPCWHFGTTYWSTWFLFDRASSIR